MTELFRGYEQEFISGVTTTSKRIESIPTLTNHKKELAFNDIKTDLTDCERNFKLMETDIASLPPQQKMDYLRKIRQYKRDFENCRKGLHKAQEEYALEKSKEMLIGAQLDEGDNTRSKFIRQGEVMSDTTYKLKEGVKVMYDTLEIGNNIQSDLNDHTGRLVANRKKLGGVGEDLGRSGKLIKTMVGRIQRNKFVLASVVGVIFLVIIIIMGVHFARKKQ